MKDAFDKSWLAFDGTPRVVLLDPPNDPFCGARRRRLMLIRGACGQFCEVDRIDYVMNMLWEILDLDPALWHWQRSFFRVLFQSYFREASDAPAWIKIAPSRLSFVARSADVAATPAFQKGRILQGRSLPVRDLPRGRITLNGMELPTARLLMRSALPRDEESRRKSLSLQRVEIRRHIAPVFSGQTLHTTEYWCTLGCAGDDDEQAAREREGIEQGLNPAAEQFRQNGVLSAPLISLCYLTKGSGHVISRCFSLSPGEGRLVDLRECNHQTAYYLTTDRTNADLLRWSAYAGLSESL